MPYLFNSLVFLAVLLLSWNFSPSFSIENDEFILPQKKAYSIGSTNTNPKKPKIVIRQNDTIDNKLPRKKPLKKFKSAKVKKTKNIEKNIEVVLPRKKPVLKEDKQKIISDKKIVEKTVEKKEINKIEKVQNTKKTLKKEELKDKSLKTTNVIDGFVYPLEKPLGFKVRASKQVMKSKILNTSDYMSAKEIFKLIKKRKWDSALSLTKNVKDKEFHNLVKWMYLKENNNKASFNDYVNFISKNPDYPRINRLR